MQSHKLLFAPAVRLGTECVQTSSQPLVNAEACDIGSHSSQRHSSKLIRAQTTGNNDCCCLEGVLKQVREEQRCRISREKFRFNSPIGLKVWIFLRSFLNICTIVSVLDLFFCR